jgi:hypothetical protein
MISAVTGGGSDMDGTPSGDREQIMVVTQNPDES